MLKLEIKEMGKKKEQVDGKALLNVREMKTLIDENSLIVSDYINKIKEFANSLGLSVLSVPVRWKNDHFRSKEVFFFMKEEVIKNTEIKESVEGPKFGIYDIINLLSECFLNDLAKRVENNQFMYLKEFCKKYEIKEIDLECIVE